MENAKLARLVHYICSQVSDYKRLSKTKIHKILWFADRDFMFSHHRTISGAAFIKMPHGPVAKSLDEVLNKLVENKAILHKVFVNHGYEQNSFISLKEPDISIFSAEEISVLDQYIEAVKKMSASEISAISHDTDWEIAVMGEAMPAELVFNDEIREPTQEDIEWAVNAVKRLEVA